MQRYGNLNPFPLPTKMGININGYQFDLPKIDTDHSDVLDVVGKS